MQLGHKTNPRNLKLIKNGLKAVVMASCLSLSAGTAFAADNPLQGKTINIYVGFAAGGAMDLTGRVIGDAMKAHIDNSIVVQNRPGAGGNVATDFVIKSPADGTSLLLGGYTNALAPSLYKQLNHNPLQDLEPVAEAVTTVPVLVVKPETGIKSLQDLIALAKKKPGELAYSSSGVGTSSHLAVEMLASMAGVEFLHVPYKGSPEQMSSLLGDQVAFSSIVLSQAVPQIKAGKLTALAVTGAQRNSQLPEVPTVAESGYPEYSHTQWYAFFGPKGIPAGTVNFLNDAINKALASPEVIEKLRANGLEPAQSTPAELAALFKSETENFAKLAKQANIVPQ